MDNKKQESMDKQVNNLPQKQPDENSGVHVQGHIKIHDPESDQVFVEGRA